MATESNRFGILIVSTALIQLVACSKDKSIHDPTLEGRSSDPAGQPQYLQYGLAVPVGQEILLPPEPYNPKKHGPPIKNTSANDNIVGRPGFIAPPPPGSTFGKPATSGELLTPLSDPPEPGTGDRGIWLFVDTIDWYGVSAMHEVRLDLSIPLDSVTQFVYAPTLMPPGYACIEATNMYARYNGSPSTQIFQGWFEWCGAGPRWAILEPVGATPFLEKYVRTYNGQPTVAITIVGTSASGPECWAGLMYNYQVGGWEEKLSSCGEGSNAWGWTMWESYFLTSCPAFPDIRVMNLRFADPRDSSWKIFTDYPSSYQDDLGPNGACWGSFSYWFSFPGAGLGPNSWHAFTSTPE